MHKEQADTKLANMIVALKVGTKTKGTCYSIAPSPTPTLGASDFVRDWRVVGALETKCLERGWRIELTSGAIRIRESSDHQSQVLIIEHGIGPRGRGRACAKALTEFTKL